MIEGICCVCGDFGQLSYEHVPPEKAFNDGSMINLDVKHHLLEEISSSVSQMRRQTARRGSGRYTLCQKCNDNTGAWYVPAYVSWAYQCETAHNVTPPSTGISTAYRADRRRVSTPIGMVNH
jgi:hypothetical protein